MTRCILKVQNGEWGPFQEDNKINIEFRPGKSRVYYANLVVRTEGIEPIIIPIVGICCDTDVNSINFEDIYVDQTSEIFTINMVGFDPAKASIEPHSDFSDISAFKIEETFYDSETYTGNLKISFNPEYEKDYTAILYLNNFMVTKRIYLSGKGVLDTIPYIRIDARDLEFSDTPKDSTSWVREICISTSNLTHAVQYSLIGQDASYFDVEEIHWNEDAGGTLDISFTPDEIRTYDASLVINSEGAVSKTIRLKGTCPLPQLTVSTSSVNFGKVVINTSKEKIIKIAGKNLVNDLDIEITGTYSQEEFQMERVNWNPRTGGDVKITFTPASTSVSSIYLRVFAGDIESDSIFITGIGTLTPVSPELMVDITELDFLNCPLGTSSEEKYIHVSGTDLTGEISYVWDDGSDASAFKIREVSWDSQSGGVLGVTFTSTTWMPSIANLKISTPGVEDKIVSLKGYNLTVSSDTIVMEDTELNETSYVWQFTVSGIDLEDPASYSLRGNEKDIAAFNVEIVSYDPIKVTGELEVHFTPTEERDYHVEFVVNHPQAPRTVSIIGKGIKGLSDYTGQTQIEGKETNLSFVAYPNPFIDILIVTIPEKFTNETLEIYSSGGDLVKRIQLIDLETIIDANSLLSGIYFVKINGQSVKIIKN
ncbi:MAG: T9SS type A sorting domain-containing protein [Bacteroidales bacterium]|nr:T9SS type A sorting domain-containing protein [Bacteroidales bacterium]